MTNRDANDLVPATGELLVYVGDDGAVHVQVRLAEGTVWLTQKLMAQLYGKDVRTINEHLKNIYEEGELEPEATIRKFRIVQTERNRSVSRLVDHYSLAAILAVGYRVRSMQGTRFRQWATARLDEYLVKGFVMDDARLASGAHLGEDRQAAQQPGQGRVRAVVLGLIFLKYISGACEGACEVMA